MDCLTGWVGEREYSRVLQSRRVLSNYYREYYVESGSSGVEHPGSVRALEISKLGISGERIPLFHLGHTRGTGGEGRMR